MPIGGPDKAARLEQLRTFARVQVWSGYRGDAEVRADVYDAVASEESDPGRAQALTDAYVADAQTALETAAQSWGAVTDFDRLQAVLADLRAGDVVVLEAVEDHWAANEKLQELTAGGRQPWGIAYFTHTDIWHAVEHGMLEVNVWHGTSANVAPGDELLAFVCSTFDGHGLPALFDEGRIEVSVAWQRRPLVV